MSEIQDLFHFQQDKGKQKPSPLVSLEADLKTYAESLQEIAHEIIDEQVTQYPIFLAHQHELNFGEVVISRTELACEWDIHVSTLEEMLERKLILPTQKPHFIQKLKDPRKYMAVLVIVPEGANFIFMAY
jgi:hypothetical protein